MCNKEELGDHLSGQMGLQNVNSETIRRRIEKILADNKSNKDFSIGKIYKILKIEKPTEADLKVLNDAELNYVLSIFSLEKSESELPDKIL